VTFEPGSSCTHVMVPRIPWPFKGANNVIPSTAGDLLSTPGENKQIQDEWQAIRCIRYIHTKDLFYHYQTHTDFFRHISNPEHNKMNGIYTIVLMK